MSSSNNQPTQPQQTQPRSTLLDNLTSALADVTKTAGATAGGVLGTVGDTVTAAGRGAGTTLEQTARGLG